MRMLAPYKPTNNLFPTVLVSTHVDPVSKIPVTDSCFVYAKTVEDAIFSLAATGGHAPHISGWIRVAVHKNIEEALDFGRKVSEAFLFKENQEKSGWTLYKNLYDNHCPSNLKV